MTMSPNFLTKTKFSKMIEEVVYTKRISYMDAVIHICEENEFEIEDMRKYISNVIIEKIEAEAIVAACRLKQCDSRRDWAKMVIGLNELG